MRSTRYSSRRGSVYALVLGTVAIAVAMVLGGLELSQIASRRALVEADVLAARALADSAVEQGLARLAQDPEWRKSLDGVDIDLTVKEAGNGTMTARVFDPDGDLQGKDRDDAVLRGIGTVGRACQMTEVTVRPTPRAVGALRSAIHAVGAITVSGSLVSDAAMTSDVSVSASGSARVGAEVMAPTVSGVVYLRRVVKGSPGLNAPAALNVPAGWASQGTSIPIGSISGRKIEQQHLSPTNNPWGLADPRGIYVIDCKGNAITVCDTAIDGTLVLLNAGAGTVFNKGVRITAPPGQPALVVQGAATLAIATSTFEVPAIGGGTIVGGLLGGTGLLTTTESSGIEGAVYITGAAVLAGITPIHGSMICNSTLDISGAPRVRHMPELLDAPPDEFWDVLEVRIAPGSWKQAVEE